MEQEFYKLLIYVRVSTEDQAEKGYSIEGQIQACRAKALELGYTEGDIAIVQDELSGATLDRPGLSKLRQLISSPLKPETIVMFDPDRFARNLTHQLLVTDEILKYGVKLEFVNFEWKNTPEGIMYYQLRGIFAQYEREKIRERTMRGRLIKLQNYGKLSFDPRLFGYFFDTEKDVLHVSNTESSIVKLIFQLAASGKSGEEIARTLAQYGIPAPRGNRWHGSTVTRILKNRSYLGTYMAYKTDNHKGYKRKRPESEQIPIAIEPIVDMALFEQAQRTLQKHRTRSGRPSLRTYLLSGIGTCFCGKSMVANGSSGNRRYSYYTCTAKTKTSYNSLTGLANQKCPCKNFNTEVVDKAIWSKIRSLLLQMNFTLNESSTAEKLIQQTDNESTELQVMTKHLQELTKQADKLLDLYLSGGIDLNRYKCKLAETEHVKELLSARMEQIKTDISSARKRWDQNERLDSQAKLISALNNISLIEKKQIIAKLVKQIIFQADGTLTVVLNFDFAARINKKEEVGQPH